MVQLRLLIRWSKWPNPSSTHRRRSKWRTSPRPPSTPRRITKWPPPLTSSIRVFTISIDRLRSSKIFETHSMMVIDSLFAVRDCFLFSRAKLVPPFFEWISIFSNRLPVRHVRHPLLELLAVLHAVRLRRSRLVNGAKGRWTLLGSTQLCSSFLSRHRNFVCFYLRHRFNFAQDLVGSDCSSYVFI